MEFTNRKIYGDSDASWACPIKPMNQKTKSRLGAGLVIIAGILPALGQTNLETAEMIGKLTNGPIILDLYRHERTVISTQQFRLPPFLATNAAFATNQMMTRLRTNSYVYTNLVFGEFEPGSVLEAAWTNFLTWTNGRDMRIWSERKHSADFPTNPPSATWNTNSLIWGMHGMTAISPSWAAQGAPGQIALTALTRRHVYARGHGMGADGFGTGFAGMKAWFLTTNNDLVEVKIKRSVVRTKPAADDKHRDYTILLLDRDLPPGIEPMRVTSMEEVLTNYMFVTRVPYPVSGVMPVPVFQTEQTGSVSSGVPPLTVNTWKGGDSGSPNMIPLPGELIFYSGRSTTGPTTYMQEDMDELCRLEKLDPQKYQMQWVHLDELPKATAK